VPGEIVVVTRTGIDVPCIHPIGVDRLDLTGDRGPLITGRLFVDDCAPGDQIRIAVRGAVEREVDRRITAGGTAGRASSATHEVDRAGGVTFIAAVVARAAGDGLHFFRVIRAIRGYRGRADKTRAALPAGGAAGDVGTAGGGAARGAAAEVVSGLAPRVPPTSPWMAACEKSRMSAGASTPKKPATSMTPIPSPVGPSSE